MNRQFLLFLRIYVEKTVPVAVPADLSDSVEFESGFRISFRIQLHYLHPVRRYSSYKRDVMLFAHLVADSDEVLVLYDLY